MTSAKSFRSSKVCLPQTWLLFLSASRAPSSLLSQSRGPLLAPPLSDPRAPVHACRDTYSRLCGPLDQSCRGSRLRNYTLALDLAEERSARLLRLWLPISHALVSVLATPVT